MQHGPVSPAKVAAAGPFVSLVPGLGPLLLGSHSCPMPAPWPVRWVPAARRPPTLCLGLFNLLPVLPSMAL